MAHYRWVLSCILILSSHFRDAVSMLPDRHWCQLTAVLLRNQPSIELFAKVRRLSHNPLIDTDPAFATAFNNHLPYLGTTTEMLQPIQNARGLHDYVCPGVLQAKGPLIRSSGFQGRVDVDHNLYSHDDWIHHPRPATWPAECSYPKDPTTRRSPGTVCSGSGCFGTRLDCGCTPDSSQAMLRPLVELYDYGQKGIGIRSLARIPKDKHVGEYVGRVLPLRSEQTSDFIFELDLGIGQEKQVVGIIDSEREGNFLRYVNHSCDPNCTFEYAAFGSKLHVLVSTLRSIDIYEELTISYGEDYFTSDTYLLCRCGSAQCAFRTVEQIQARLSGSTGVNSCSARDSSTPGFAHPNQARKVRPQKIKIGREIWKKD